MERKFQYEIWKMPEWNGRFHERNGRQSSILPYIGVARIFDWGGPNHKLYAMTSSEIFRKGTFCGAKIS